MHNHVTLLSVWLARGGGFPGLVHVSLSPLGLPHHAYEPHIPEATLTKRLQIWQVRFQYQHSIADQRCDQLLLCTCMLKT